MTPRPEETRVQVRQAYRYALDPTSEQSNALRSHIGGSRFVYNALLGLVKANWDENRAKRSVGIEVTKADYLGTSHLDLQKLWYENRDRLAPWWAENGSSTYNYACLNLSKAFTNHRKGRAKFPTFKRRGPAGSVSFLTSAVRLADSHHVRVTRIGEIKTYESMRKLHRHLERGTGRVVSSTVSSSNGTFFIAFNVELTRVVPVPRAPERIVGVDVGLTTLYTGATTSGKHVLHVENPCHFITSEKKLVHAQRIAARRRGPKKGVAASNRWKKANGRVQRIHATARNARANLIRETTSALAKNYDVIVIEDLNVAGMLKNHSLAKHISGAAWGEFARQLEYKTKWYGSTLVKADRFYPSSKTCAQCGTVKAKLSLATRTYACESCGHTVDRDLNAAINLARMGLPGTNSGTGRGGEVSPESRNVAVTAHPGEASTETPLAVGV
ncbi:MAG TPA: IS607 family element RNA-guided endonuclease TnpB [Acidimicrobiales bacterium]|nr:IS607 family element RNA-guided endonuclease TnpB [Acidimicrobiales bacterium]